MLNYQRVPQNGWFVMDNPSEKWMMTGATPMTIRNPPFDEICRFKHQEIRICVQLLLPADSRTIGF